MAFRIYNSLANEVEEFSPLRGNEVRMYTCGPTVYHFVHIGNFRTFVFQDLLRRFIRYKGFKLTHVMNITDVEDKIIRNATQEGISIGEYTKRYEDAFLQDMATLRIERPEIMPRATEHISEMVDLVETLQRRGHTYQSEGSIYFRINSFAGYGKLSNLEPGSIDGGGQEDADEYTKENPRDFVLWKARREGEAYWDTSLGEGRPGWHLECSAMSMKYLGESFDIHCGGVDLVFPHHENEIAQSEGATGKPFVRYWVHGAHLIVDGQKMSKSLGNYYTLRDLLERGLNPLALRYLLASVHYRNQLNFTFEGVEQAQAAIQRVNDLLLRVREIPSDRHGDPALQGRVEQALSRFESALDDDLNASAALATVFELVRDVNVDLQNDKLNSADRALILDFFRKVNSIFDVFQVEADEMPDEEITQLIEERQEARRQRDFGRADEIRAQLAARGILLEDTKDGVRWKRRFS